MNRIIIIGNGFDRAHNLRTGYKEFIDDYWSEFAVNITNEVSKQFGISNMIKSFSDDYFSLEEINYFQNEEVIPLTSIEKPKSYKELSEYIENYNKNLGIIRFKLRCNNSFFGHISEQCSPINWFDIENEYYEELKKILFDIYGRSKNERVRVLNKELNAVKKLLERHLTKVTNIYNNIEKHKSIDKAFSSPVEFDDISTSKQREFVNSIFSKIERFGICKEFEDDKKNDPQYNVYSTIEEERMHFFKKNKDNEYFNMCHCIPQTLLLNFNYTNTAEKLYTNEEIKYEIINIHGELNNKNNPIIFGYGDELDENYQKIEKTQDNDFLENIKSIKYHQTRNYRKLLMFIESGIYQVFVMGHSCGNSDRTLLNTLFEHNNCVSIKVFYRQFEDGTDDYSNLIKNISRNFNNKLKMRDIVVNREYCSPLVPNIKSKPTKE